MKNTKNFSMAVMLSLFLVACENGTNTNKSEPTSSDSSGKLVEVMLASKSEETRGYCLDIAGGKGKNAPLDKGLQAHTCYSYTGNILEDQGFDSALISKGQFRISYFDVCVSASSFTKGSTLLLSKCDQSEAQEFTLKINGHLVSQKNPELCITVNSAQKKEGRGGSPVHVMRPISLELCEDSKDIYQKWLLNEI